MTIGAALVVAIVGAGSAAYSYWRGTGSGSGSGSTGTVAAVTLTSGTASAGLMPGGQVDVTLIVNNPNTAPVMVTSFGLDTAQGTGGYAVDASHVSCSLPAALTFTRQTNGTGWSIPSNGSLSITLSNALGMTTTAANGCQGATFTVYLAAGS